MYITDREVGGEVVIGTQKTKQILKILILGKTSCYTGKENHSDNSLALSCLHNNENTEY